MIRIIPAIDIIGGRCVRLLKGDYDQLTTYADDPLSMAKRFENSGLGHLHLVDLDGAREGRIINLRVLETIASGTSLHIDFGGGLRTREDIDSAFSAGASAINAGSVAVKDPSLVKGWIQTYGPEKIILGADVKGDRIATHGWTKTSEVTILDFLRDFRKAGLRYTACTDVEKDGMLQGPSTELYRTLKNEFPDLDIIASGGVSGMADLEELNDTGVFGVIVGKAFYENRITLTEVQQFLTR